MKLKRVLREEMILINFRVTEEEFKQIEKKAAKYTEGNKSEWLRYAAIELEPKPKDLVRN